MTDNRPAGPGAWPLASLLAVLCLLLCLLAAPASATPALSPPGQEVRADEDPKATGDGEKATHLPEPSTWLLLGTGLAVIVLFHHQRHRRRQLQSRGRGPHATGNSLGVTP